MKPVIVKIKQTCYACPSQWDMWTKEGDYYYVRYRYGWLSLDKVVGSTWTELYAEEKGGEWDGIMDTDEMMKHLSDIIAFADEVEEIDGTGWQNMDSIS